MLSIIHYSYTDMIVLIIDLLQTNETELKQFFSVYGAVKDCKIIVDRGGISKRFESTIKYATYAVTMYACVMSLLAVLY